MTAEIRLATLDEYPAVAAFIDQHWKKDHAYVRNKALFDWTFRDAPSWGRQPSYSVSVALDAGEIVGMLGVIPFSLNDHGRTSKAGWLVNWLVIPEARKGRTGVGLLNVFSGTLGYDTISFGINDTIARLYAALKWQHMPPIPRLEWINPARSDEVEQFLAGANPTATVAQVREYIGRHGAVPVAANVFDAMPLESVESTAWDKKGWAAWSARTVGCARDHAYLKWRYLEHPTFRYETRVCAEGTGLGLIVWRLETTRRCRPDGSLEDHVLFARVLEFLPVSERNAAHLMATFLGEAMASGAAAADFYCYNLELCQLLTRMGFSFAADTEAVCLPNHTQPIAQGHAIRSSIKVSSTDAVRADDPDWYWTRSDSDQDRPN